MYARDDTDRVDTEKEMKGIMASSQTPMSVLPHILSKLSSSGCDSIMFQILKEKSDILVGSR